MVLNVRGLKVSISSEKRPFAALLLNSSSNDFVSLLYQDEQSCPWPLVQYMIYSIGSSVLEFGFEFEFTLFDFFELNFGIQKYLYPQKNK